MITESKRRMMFSTEFGQPDTKLYFFILFLELAPHISSIVEFYRLSL